MGTTDIHDLLEAGDVGGFRQALATNPGLLDQDIDAGDRPLHIAARHNRQELVAMLLAEGADVNGIGSNKMTPLQNAVEGNTPAVVKLLIDHEADLMIADAEGRTPFARAAFAYVCEGCDDEKQVFELLKDAGAQYDLVTASIMSDKSRVQEILTAEPRAASTVPEQTVEYVLCGILLHEWGTIPEKEVILELLFRSGLPLPPNAVRRTIVSSASRRPAVAELVRLLRKYADESSKKLGQL